MPSLSVQGCGQPGLTASLRIGSGGGADARGSLALGFLLAVVQPLLGLEQGAVHFCTTGCPEKMPCCWFYAAQFGTFPRKYNIPESLLALFFSSAILGPGQSDFPGFGGKLSVRCQALIALFSKHASFLRQ